MFQVRTVQSKSVEQSHMNGMRDFQSSRQRRHPSRDHRGPDPGLHAGKICGSVSAAGQAQAPDGFPFTSGSPLRTSTWPLVELDILQPTGAEAEPGVEFSHPMPQERIHRMDVLNLLGTQPGDGFQHFRRRLPVLQAPVTPIQGIRHQQDRKAATGQFLSVGSSAIVMIPEFLKRGVLAVHAHKLFLAVAKPARRDREARRRPGSLSNGRHRGGNPDAIRRREPAEGRLRGFLVSGTLLPIPLSSPMEHGVARTIEQPAPQTGPVRATAPTACHCDAGNRSQKPVSFWMDPAESAPGSPELLVCAAAGSLLPVWPSSSCLLTPPSGVEEPRVKSLDLNGLVLTIPIIHQVCVTGGRSRRRTSRRSERSGQRVGGPPLGQVSHPGHVSVGGSSARRRER